MKISTLFPPFLITQELAELKHPRVVVLTVSELELFGFFFSLLSQSLEGCEVRS